MAKYIEIIGSRQGVFFTSKLPVARRLVLNILLNESKKLVKKIGRDRDSDVKKGGIARLRGKNKREGGI